MCPRTDCLWGWVGALRVEAGEHPPVTWLKTLLANFQRGGPRLGDSVVQLFEGLAQNTKSTFYPNLQGWIGDE